MTASIREVAKKAGVSVSTVSRALNGYTDVKEETRKKIQETADLLGYQPNISARNLSSKSTKNIGIIVSDLLTDDNPDDFTITMLKGVYKYATEAGLRVTLVTITTEEQKKKSYNEFCREHSLSGAVLMGLKVTDPYVKKLEEAKLPCVTIDLQIPGAMVGSVYTDDEGAFEKITDYVISNHHRKLILIHGREVAEVTKLRYQGFLKAIKKHNIALEDVTILYTDYLERITYEEVKLLLEEKGKDAGTALICMSDVTAYGAIRAVQRCGYKVPADFSVSGYDGVQYRHYINPRLTTIDQNMREKGYQAALLLDQMLKGNMNDRYQMVPYIFDKGKSVIEVNRETGGML